MKVPPRKLPVDVTLELTDAVEGLVSWGSTSERPRRIDGTYPNWREILRDPNKKGAHERIGLDTRLLAPIATELDAYCALEFGEFKRTLYQMGGTSTQGHWPFERSEHNELIK